MTSRTVSRRTFLALAGTLPFVPRLARAQQRAVPVGLELYSVRNFLQQDLMGTIRAVAGLGYEVVEFYSPYYSWTPETAREVRKLMDDLGIRCLSTHNGANVFEPDNLQKAIDLNHAIGSKAIIMAGPGRVSTLDDWKRLVERLNAAAERLKPHGMSAGFHNHQLEWRPVEGTRPMDLIAKGTPKEFILQLDVGTALEAGVDPVAWIRANPGRIRSMHCKDWASDGRGYTVVFGEGNAPWKAIFEAAESVGGIECYLIEQEAGPAEEQMQRAERCLANWKRMRA